jgi:hypothetical protein
VALVAVVAAAVAEELAQLAVAELQLDHLSLKVEEPAVPERYLLMAAVAQLEQHRPVALLHSVATEEPAVVLAQTVPVAVLDSPETVWLMAAAEAQLEIILQEIRLLHGLQTDQD